MDIGPHRIDPPLVLAPMAGVTDRVFRGLCRRLGAGLVVSEMTTADPTLWFTEKSRLRREHDAESAPISVQIAGTDPATMARAAAFNVEQGAQIIDINMGCPAKKVCRVDAGSALMKDEALVERILSAVVAASPVPVTLKIRTGWARSHRNAVKIARIAQDCGIAALTVHGRTREDHYEGAAEYTTVAEVKAAVRIPVIANGDVDSGPKALEILRQTGADGLMIGRAALGHPWIFRELAHFLKTGEVLPQPDRVEVASTLLQHMRELYTLYGESRGVRVARKHIQWYCQSHPGVDAFWASVNRVDDASEQLDRVTAFFEREPEELAEAA
ncbi:tRNA-U20-dihydrouridine synthase [Panacagrimonas perspica]|uniref:tRNA-dihydrouridine synthase B n=1 Tax=Panacagrimonas perspica TaxID=381431 RepID=A0A4R7NYH5_9GAMM|nr:tRNA dihydrouridine synthase DusB [Panacagrimonas perspica]TDU25781.1 tRNA-U20-dihydrouridine synthase [Panacagrimonas perspica]THD02843.1 tRNA dihydrouridine synthase DusB [Panacagrimonas perspica]